MTDWICVQSFPKSDHMKLESNSKRDKHNLFVDTFAYQHVTYLTGDQSVSMANADMPSLNHIQYLALNIRIKEISL